MVFNDTPVPFSPQMSGDFFFPSSASTDPFELFCRTSAKKTYKKPQTLKAAPL